MRTLPNPDGSVRPAVPRTVLRLVGLFFRVLWHCIPARTLCRACNYRRGERIALRHRAVLWIHGQWPLWDQEPNINSPNASREA